MHPTTDPSTTSHPEHRSANSGAPPPADTAQADVHGHQHAPSATPDVEMIVTLDEHTKLAESFDELKLSPRILESVIAAGYSKPTPIQSLFIPRAMTGLDVMGQAQTGTVKTAAFLLPIFEALKPGT